MQVDRAGVDAFAQNDVDAEVLHRRIEKLLDRLGHAMDFVDEQDRSFFDVRQIGEQVLGRGQGRPAGDLHGNAHVAGDAGGEGRLAQARRAVQEDMAQRFAALRGGIDGDAQPLMDLALADHVRASAAGEDRDLRRWESLRAGGSVRGTWREFGWVAQ